MKSEITKHEENYSVYQSKDSFELVQRQASNIGQALLFLQNIEEEKV
tara:strand:+ start:248 stop:388 length:141 start_codon:yes stop_codon:yes gene_type:complete